jgi:C_GCAxxG_C_C family probable redox protein
MKLKLSLNEAKAKALEYLNKGYHCGPSVLKVMWETYGMENEDSLWAGTVFRGGFAGQQQAPCGAVSGSAVALGLHHRCSTADNEKAEKARQAACDDAVELVKSFEKKFGSITCIGLLGIEFTDESAMKQAKESGHFDNKCPEYVKYAIEKLYEIESKREAALH